jgi:hypothetical protein
MSHYRTTIASVKEILDHNYGASSTDITTSPSITPYIATAAALVDRMVVCATSKGVSFGDSELELIERWLAAHCYSQMDPGYQELETGDAKGMFTGVTGKALENSRYGQMALSLDHSGCLLAITTQKRAKAFWNGTREADRRTHHERNY